MAKTLKREVGDIGESYTCNFLEKSGYTIIERNYLKKWGELDIIASKKGIMYFIEVKTITSNFFFNGTNWYRPEDNVHKWKIRRLKRTIQTYLAEREVSDEVEWEFSVITVVIKRGTHELYRIEHLENLII